LAVLAVLAVLSSACATSANPSGIAQRPPPGTANQAPPAAVATITSGLQEDLRRLGYDPGPLGGTFDSSTAAALVRFQSDAGVAEKGALGPLTARALTTRRAAASEAVRALQSALTDVGLFGGVIDGRYGDDLLAAVRTLQRSEGIPTDGQYGIQTATALSALYRRKVPVSSSHEEPPTSTADLATTSTTNPDNLLQLGSSSDKVLALQQRLTSLGYRPGSPDGLFGAATASAVLAYQKHEGLPRDGIAGPVVQGDVNQAPHGAGPRPGLPTPRIEVDLARQIAFVVLPGQPVVMLNVSTGSGMHYVDPGPGGGDDVAYTPVGTFAVQRKVAGDVKAPLGTLHSPLYFFQGWAIHGAASVPAYPASHGCVRVSDDDADWLFPQVALGTAVVVYDSTKGATSAPTGATPGY